MTHHDALALIASELVNLPHGRVELDLDSLMDPPYAALVCWRPGDGTAIYHQVDLTTLAMAYAPEVAAAQHVATIARLWADRQCASEPS